MIFLPVRRIVRDVALITQRMCLNTLHTTTATQSVGYGFGVVIHRFHTKMDLSGWANRPALPALVALATPTANTPIPQIHSNPTSYIYTGLPNTSHNLRSGRSRGVLDSPRVVRARFRSGSRQCISNGFEWMVAERRLGYACDLPQTFGFRSTAIS